MTDRIETPRGTVVKTGSASCTLEWKPGFGPEMTARYGSAQAYVDGEVLRLSEPYAPMRTGMLIKSGQLGTKLGSGLVAYIAPYAKQQYYSPQRAGGTGSLRGPQWFERMKADHGEKIVAGAKKRAGGGK